MEKLKINRRKTSFFSELANQINDQQKDLKEFVQAPFSIENFGEIIQTKKQDFTRAQRQALSEVVNQQLADYKDYSKVKSNIDLLAEENTFTVTAGHQLNLYGGPLYVIYKIMDAIKMAEELKEAYPTNNFVPVFWLATEDHDFEEINHLHLFHDKMTWNTDQKGPVGRFSLDDIDTFKSEILDKFDNNPEYAKFLDQFYKKGNLAEATIELMMSLFGDYGLIVLDADNTKLKSTFSPIVKKEIETHFSEREVLKTTNKLENIGFHGQAMARPINLFYIKDQFRERIIPLENETFQIGEETVSKVDLLKDLEQNPECFSPNVILRPLYQEFILPNLCYIGGGGEMSYWLQFKAMFEEVKIPFPLLKVRNSVQWFDKSTTKKFDKLGLNYLDVFESIHAVKKQYVLDNAEVELDFTTLQEKSEALVTELIKTVTDLDKGLEGYSKSEATKIQKQIDQLQQKLIRHQKKKSDDAMKQIDGIYKRLFPNNGLQERYETMVPFLGKYGVEEFVEMVYNLIEPSEEDLIVMVDK
ncbi:bacillithiol biosynthesis cysteine-adding enzyme BshC [Brumimicrobium aurantiacum]|uniref:Putative cysteine ligase BshC n=1 Tax=Brumimicrobium aurantiacum TaxID=1737063 RepID=A0A3E1EWC4_9FLAO|nr:bacillithiol biosynthesis cysteine-adding enzyme BshC [Brumimicrobium aurantiacum]RFC53860.1 bacillithiol biosynthesis cysteine-adding enzyme BshC [Brumimicrobium aurantiacum]